MLVIVERDEWYPVYTLNFDDVGAIEITTEFYDQYKQLDNAFWAMQTKLRELHKQQRKGQISTSWAVD